jgi:hypothetical protein
MDLTAISGIRVAYSGARLRAGGECDILVASFSGVYREGSAGELDARFIHAFGQAAVIAWEPEGMILDFSNLEYRRGDDLRSILDIGERAFGIDELPKAVVVGPGCEEGVRSLFDSREPDPFPEWIFREFQAAWGYVESEMDDLRARLGSIMRPPVTG